MAGSVRHLSDGIVWVSEEVDNQGRWRNAAELFSYSATVDITRISRLWGWLQIGIKAAWREAEPQNGYTVPLAAKSSAAVELLWE
jgi:hypothetical protein